MNLYDFSLEKKSPGEKEGLHALVICNEISFINSFSIFVGSLLAPTDLLSYDDEIKLFHLN